MDSKVGKTFGYLKITGIKKNCNKDKVYECKCECGKKVSRRNSSLLKAIRQNRKPSCGCIDGTSQEVKKFNKYYSKIKSLAKKESKQFLLNKNEFKNIVSSPCYYCGNTLKHGIQFISLVNLEEDYHISNSVSCCEICLLVKKELSMPEFEEWVDRIYKTMQRNKLGLPTGEIIQVAI